MVNLVKTVEELEKMASDIEDANPIVAVALDRICDAMEGRTALFGIKESITSKIEDSIKKFLPIAKELDGRIVELNGLLDEAQKEEYKDKSQKGAETLKQLKMLIPVQKALESAEAKKLLNRLSSLK